jgi:hypothetical protein
MTSIWSNMECIYSMPGVGPTKATTTASVVSAAAAAQFSLESLWPSGGVMLGKSLVFRAGGTYDATNVSNLLSLSADPTVTSQTSAVTVAATGAALAPSTTVGMWDLFVEATCSTVGAGTSGWVTSGWLEYGINAGTAITTRYSAGGANTLGIPNTVAIVPSTAYFWELWSTWGTAPTAFVCSKYKIYAEN